MGGQILQAQLHLGVSSSSSCSFCDWSGVHPLPHCCQAVNRRPHPTHRLTLVLEREEALWVSTQAHRRT
jgi:hypothetical protein